MRSRFAPPGDSYLRTIGELAYAVSSLEGLLIFDVPRLSSALPSSFTAEGMVGATTTSVGQRFLDVAAKATDVRVRTYCETGGQALREVGSIRNDVLHARPATSPTGQQRLYRYLGSREFMIEDSWLEAALDQIDKASSRVEAVRPSLDIWPG